MTQSLVRLMAPALSFTAHEAWETVNGQAQSVFEQTWYALPQAADADVLRERWQKLRTLRSSVLKLLEDLIAHAGFHTLRSGGGYVYRTEPEGGRRTGQTGD